MLGLFNFLSKLLESNSYIAVCAAFSWGVLSILLSPCHLSSIPLIVGFINGQGKVPIKRAFWLSSLFSLGILITIAVIGLVTSLIGRMLGDIGPYGNYIVAGILIVMGLHLLEVINIPFLGNASQPGYRKKGLIAAFIMGFLFGAAVGPCTFAFMLPVLGIVFKVSSTNLPLAVSLVLFYAIGHCSVIIIAGTFTGLVQKYLNWNEKSKGAVIVKKICGALIIVAGIYLLKK